MLITSLGADQSYSSCRGDQTDDCCPEFAQRSDVSGRTHRYKEEEEEDESAETKTEEPDEAERSPAAADGTLLVFQDDGVAWLIEDHKLSESLKAAILGDGSDAQSQHIQGNGPSCDVATTERREAEDDEQVEDRETPELRSGGKTETET